jgi:peptidyl-tRNA hydrolase, PTH2 family
MKQVIVARRDLGMSAGKLAAQVAHAAIGAYDVAPHDYVDVWKREGVTKVVLQVDGENGLLQLYRAACAEYLPTSLVCDEGRTEVVPGTITCLGIGPAPNEVIDRVTGRLKLYGYAEA